MEFISNGPNVKANLPCSMVSLLLVPNNNASALPFLKLTIKSFLINYLNIFSSSLFNTDSISSADLPGKNTTISSANISTSDLKRFS